MKRGWVFVLIVGIAVFIPCGAETDLGQLNNQTEATSDPKSNDNDSKIWRANSSTQFPPTLFSGIAEGIILTPGIDKGITLTPGVAKGITLTPGIDKGITMTPGIDKGINKTIFICNII